MDALLLTQVGANEPLESVDRRSEGAKEVTFAHCRQQQDAIGIDEVWGEYDGG